MDAFAESNPGHLAALIDGSLGKSDLMLLQAMQCLKNEKLWPYYPLKLKGSVKGNLQQLAFDGLKAVLPSAFEISAHGTLSSLTDMNKLKANVNLNARTYNLGFITAMLEPSLMKEICVPNGIGIKGNINVDGQRYATKLALTEGRGSLNIDASVIAKLTLLVE